LVLASAIDKRSPDTALTCGPRAPNPSTVDSAAAQRRARAAARLLAPSQQRLRFIAETRRSVSSTWESFRRVAAARPCRPAVYENQAFSNIETAASEVPDLQYCLPRHRREPSGRHWTERHWTADPWTPVPISFENVTGGTCTIIINVEPLHLSTSAAGYLRPRLQSWQLPTTAGDITPGRVRIQETSVRTLSCAEPSVSAAHRIFAGLLWLSTADEILGRYRGVRQQHPGASSWSGRIGVLHPLVYCIPKLDGSSPRSRRTDYNVSALTECTPLSRSSPDCLVSDPGSLLHSLGLWIAK